MDELNEKKVEGLHKAVLKSKKDLRDYNEWRTENNTLFSDFDKKMEAQNARIKENRDQIERLGSLVDNLRNEGTNLINELKRTPKGPAYKLIDERSQNIEARAVVVVSKIRTLEQETKKIKKDGKDLEDNYRDLFNRIGTTPERYLKIQKRMEERAKALKSENPSPSAVTDVHYDQHWKLFRDLFTISRATLSMQLDFKITENNNANADGTLKWPLHLGSLSLIYKAGSDKKREAQRLVHITSTFEELTNDELTKCQKGSLDPPDKRARTYPIVGHVGVDEFVKQWFAIITEGQALATGTGKDTFTDTLTFTTKISGKLNPTIEIAPVSPSLVKGGLDLVADRQDLHVVTVQVRPYSPKPDGSDSKVQITKIPNVTVNITEGPDGHGSSIDVQ